MVKVSIIVPVYNTEKYLDKCLDSLVKQTLKEIQIIIVNDGSTDNSIKICKQYEEKYKNKILYLEKENGGLSDARNYAFSHIEGEYVGFVDSDDYIAFNMFEELYSKASKEKADLAECDFLWEYPNETKIDIGKLITNKTDNFVFGRVLMCNKIIKSKIILDNKLEFTKGLRYEDVEFYYKLVHYINKTSLVSIPLYHYIQRENSISNLQTEKTKDIFLILHNILEFYKEENIYEEYKTELEYLYIRFLLGSSLLRMVKIKDKDVKTKLIKQTWGILNKSFPNWKQNAILLESKDLKNKYYKSVNKYTLKLYSKILKYKQ